ncbi:MAG: PAS domain S-box protein, partial [Dehalococcoidales bacterium]|nr:PAS domain S-box protein [Dehalococcoidales bacterium]
MAVEKKKRMTRTSKGITDGKKTEERLSKAREDLQLLIQERTKELAEINRALQAEISEHHRAQDSLDIERQRLNNVLEMLPVYVVLLTQDYHVPFANRFFRERFGESHGKRCFEYLFKRNEPCEVCESFKVLRTKAPHHWEWTGPDGHIYDIFDFPFTDTDGTNLIMEMGIDITEQRKAQEALHKAHKESELRVQERTTELSEARDYLDNLLNYANAPIIVWSPDLKITRFNHAFERITGRKAEEVLGKKLDILFPADSREESMKHIRGATSGERWEVVEIPIKHKDGSVYILLWNSATIYAPDSKKVVATIAQGQDITERKKAEIEKERLLKESTDRLNELQTLLDNAQVAIWITRDIECREITGNIFANQLLGVKPGDNISRSAKPSEAAVNYKVFRGNRELKPEELPAQVAAASGKSVPPYEVELAFDSGRRINLIMGAVPLLDVNGSVRGAVAMGTDITERKKTEESLREARDYLDNLFNYANAPIIVWNPELKITRFNHAFEQLTGRKAEEVLGKKLDILFPADTRDECMKHIRGATSGERWEVVEIPIEHKDGTVYILLWNSATIFASDGKTIVATIAQGQDITERKKTEEIKDELIGLVSHELRTPMTVITGSLRTAMSEG